MYMLVMCVLLFDVCGVEKVFEMYMFDGMSHVVWCVEKGTCCCFSTCKIIKSGTKPP
jgi:hypothetical protein